MYLSMLLIIHNTLNASANANANVELVHVSYDTLNFLAEHHDNKILETSIGTSRSDPIDLTSDDSDDMEVETETETEAWTIG